MAQLKSRMAAGEILAGTFVKTPAVEMIEILGRSGLDFLCLDAEHSAFDRGRLDACLAVARAMDFPCLVRVEDSSARSILQALDAGAAGIVVPHVDSVGKAAEIAKAAHYGHGGRGFAGSTRSAGFATRPMSEVLTDTAKTIVLAQIEEPEGVEAASGIASTQGIDGLFLGPADLSVAYGKTDQNSEELLAALQSVGAAAAAAGKTFVTFTPDVAKARDWLRFGVTMFFVASEHAWMAQGARATAAGIHELG